MNDKIKPLEWEENRFTPRDEEWFALTPFGRFVIVVTVEDMSTIYYLDEVPFKDFPRKRHFSTLEDALEACFEHWRTAVSACLAGE